MSQDDRNHVCQQSQQDLEILLDTKYQVGNRVTDAILRSDQQTDSNVTLTEEPTE